MYVDLLYGEVETPQKALRAWDMGMIFHFFFAVEFTDLSFGAVSNFR